MTTIRRCSVDDFDAILPLLQQLWPDKTIDSGASRRVFARGVDSSSQEYICATIDSKVVGFCSLVVKNNLWQEGYLGHIDELVVEESVRGRGIGRALLDHITQSARERGCKRIELDTAFHRKAAHQFYEDNGFHNRAYLFSKVL